MADPVAPAVRLSVRTHQRLRALRGELGVRSFDEVVEILLQRAAAAPRSRFGAHPEMRPFAKSDEAMFDAG